MKKEEARLHHAANIALILAIVIFFGVGIVIGFKLAPAKVKEIVLPGEKIVTISIPAVNEAGQGVMTKLTARLKKGDGQVLVNVNDVIAGYELQLSARNAVMAVQNVSDVDMSNHDVSLSVKTDAALIEGRSASAAMAVAVLALVQDKRLNPNITITGAVESDGRISPVGMIGEKAEATRKSNMSLLLLPAGQGTGIEQVEEIKCETNGREHCTIEYKPKLVMAQYGVAVKEVQTIEEAMKWFEVGGFESHMSEFSDMAEGPVMERIIRAPGKEELGKISLDDHVPVSLETAGFFVALRHECIILPITTTEPQIEAIEKGIERKIIGRPDAYDTIKNMLGVFDVDVLAAAIDRLEAGTFYSRIIAASEEKVVSIDMRPSDAIAVAVRFSRPIYVNKELLEKYGENVC